MFFFFPFKHLRHRLVASATTLYNDDNENSFISPNEHAGGYLVYFIKTFRRPE